MKRGLSVLALLIVTVPSSSLGQDNETAARQSFERAEQLGAAGQFEEALQAYRESSRLAPDSASPHLGIGLCLAELGHDREALEALDEYLDRGRNPQSRAQAEETIRDISRRLGVGTISLPRAQGTPARTVVH